MRRPTQRPEALPGHMPATSIRLPTLPGLAKWTLIATLLPVYFTIFGLLLSPARILLLILVPILAVQLMQGKFGGFLWIDRLVFLHVMWLIMSVFVNNPEVAVTYTGSNAIVILGGYLTARASIRSREDFAALCLFLMKVVLLSLPFAILETRDSIMIIPRLIDKIPGISSSIDVDYLPRLGLNRVQFLFAHPIHYGLFCSCTVALCFIGLRDYLSLKARILITTALILCTFLSVSSGPILSMVTQIFLISWAILAKGLARKWRILTGLLAMLYAIAEIMSNRIAIYAIVSILSFSPNTANVRRVLFEYGSAQIARTPILGVGFNSWPLPKYMTGSLDNHWLLLALIYGLPSLIFLFWAIFLTFYHLSISSAKDSTFQNMRLGWVFTMISLLLTLSTVAIWGEMQSIFYFLFGSGVWMSLARAQTADAQSEASLINTAHGALTYSRFPVRARS